MKLNVVTGLFTTFQPNIQQLSHQESMVRTQGNSYLFLEMVTLGVCCHALRNLLSSTKTIKISHLTLILMPRVHNNNQEYQTAYILPYKNTVKLQQNLALISCYENAGYILSHISTRNVVHSNLHVTVHLNDDTCL